MDWDGDNDLDVVVGGRDGKLQYLENDGDGTVTEKTGSPANPFDAVDVGADSVPAFGDVDGDGDADLLVGSRGGGLSYFESDGAGAVAAKTGVANPFDGVHVTEVSFVF